MESLGPFGAMTLVGRKEEGDGKRLLVYLLQFGECKVPCHVRLLKDLRIANFWTDEEI
jgi:hypothetical protein